MLMAASCLLDMLRSPTHLLENVYRCMDVIWLPSLNHLAVSCMLSVSCLSSGKLLLPQCPQAVWIFTDFFLTGALNCLLQANIQRCYCLFIGKKFHPYWGIFSAMKISISYFSQSVLFKSLICFGSCLAPWHSYFLPGNVVWLLFTGILNIRHKKSYAFWCDIVFHK